MPEGTSASHAKQGRKASTSKNEAKQDAIQLLMSDHKEVEELFKQFQKAKKDGGDKADIVEQICDALSVHAEIEEEIFYPAARDALAEKGEDMLDEAEVEHASIKSLVEQLQDADPSEEMYDAKVKVLCEYVTHHVKEEEGEMFPKVKKTALDLEELGAELMERKQELMDEE
ncbi:MAG TPA: hemerythrin domain-containing protein [Micropepsaceae bacterium]|nr:hemerythrin domain-containing protein [Micropepsaceae bacterium]